MKILLSIVEWIMLTCLVTGKLQKEDYVILSDELPEVRFRPVIGNGHIATNVLSDTAYMNGLYNGREDKSSRARIPAFVAVDVTKDNDVSRIYELDMYYGTFRQYINMAAANVTLTYFAHRKFTRLLVTTLDVRRNERNTGEITIPLAVNKGNNSKDFVDNVQQMQQERLPWTNARYYSATVMDMEKAEDEKTNLHVYYTHVPSQITLSARQNEMSISFGASLSQDKMDAKMAFRPMMENSTDLLATHKIAWTKVWDEGRIDIEGNKNLSKDIAAATYNVLCSVPDAEDHVTPFFGLSPGGLSRGGILVPDKPGGGHNDYAGHVFWDMDTWVMPGIMMLHPDMGKRMIGSRTRVLDQVKNNAAEAGYKGVKYPWEQAATGIDATPKWAGQMSRYEIHITADIAYGLRQYLYATGDVSIVSDAERGFELALESARFWQSRVTFFKNPERAEILGVMGPDEYHYNISNSGFTNYNAKLNLLLPQYIVDNFDMHDKVNGSVREEMRQFNRTANLMVILFDENLQYHPQYEHFNRTLQIKQSDVILLGYPLMMPMSQSIRRNDLEIYENITNPEGPDTGTWSMHTVGWLELDDEPRAYRNFKMMFRNINEPFKVFSENPVTNNSNGGCVNFITAAGGLLQSVIFGYGGLRLRENSMTINPHLLPGATTWTIKGVHYRDAVFDVITDKDNVRIIPTALPAANRLVYISADSARYTMQVGHANKFRRQELSVHVNVIPSTSTTVPTTTHSGVSGIKFTLFIAQSLLVATILTSVSMF